MYRISSLLLPLQEGCEHTHVLIWVAKDYCWSQNLPTAAIVMGSIALFWCCIVMYHAIQERDAENVYMVIGTALWLFANYWWMFWEETGEDDVNHDRQTNPMVCLYAIMIFVSLTNLKIETTCCSFWQLLFMWPCFSLY